MPDTLRVIGPVSANPARASSWSPARSFNLNRLDQRFELCRFVRGAWQQQRTERQPVAIDQQVQFGTKTTA
jgi:hypothetical protein